MQKARDIKEAVLHLLFPHVCDGCGSENLSADSCICAMCIASLPKTSFEKHVDNEVEKLFWGKLPVQAAAAHFYFTKESLLQHLMHQFKYKGNKELGLHLGRIMGEQLIQTSRFANVEALVPLPLFANKERKRGYNQSTILCNGMAEVMQLPVLEKVVVRPTHTETQTRKGRIERWKNMEGKFLLADANAIKGKHILLVDDVVTTGATLEACGITLSAAADVTLSATCFCIASK
jgi:ComF family protein